ncbi:hypothetical protein AX15_002805 [Amanita polypyramis BW_CC]|nr:hypothetical protein AX15_002805 [Amanita polypyramis BW_CC]
MVGKGTKRQHASDNESPAEESSPSVSKAKSKSKSRSRKRDDGDDSAEPIATVKKPRIADASSHARRTSGGESYFDIGKKKRITVSMFKGQPLIDIREFYGDEGQEKPGKKGIALTIEQWEAVKSNIDTVDQLLSDLNK